MSSHWVLDLFVSFVVSARQPIQPDHGSFLLAEYCLRDSVLVHRLIETLSLLTNGMEMAKVTGVLLSDVWARSATFPIEMQILRAARTRQLVVPTFPAAANGARHVAAYDGIYQHVFGNSTPPSKIEGARVLESKLGYHRQPVAVLDFASLYPSIIMRHNLSWDTLVVDAATTTTTMPPNGFRFVQ